MSGYENGYSSDGDCHVDTGHNAIAKGSAHAHGFYCDHHKLGLGAFVVEIANKSSATVLVIGMIRILTR